MSNELMISGIEKVVVTGDLSGLTAEQRLFYYKQVCESVGLNPLTSPFDYIKLSGKLTLYAKKNATDQLRTLRSVSITKMENQITDNIYIATAYARDKEGREDVDTGAVSIGGLKGDALANAILKAVTKAKRRVTLSICGLGLLDESEVESMPSAEKEVKSSDNATTFIQKTPATSEQLQEIEEMVKKLNKQEWLGRCMKKANVRFLRDFTKEQAEGCLSYLNEQSSNTEEDYGF